MFQSRYQLYSINMFVYAVPALYLLVPALASTTSLPGGIVSQVSGAPSCGYDALGSVFSVTSSIEVCLPPVYCNPETCPPALGQCVNGQCQYLSGYKGLATYPHAIATYYCQLDTGGCNGALGGSIFDMATTAASHLHLPLCTPTSTGNCMGIAATSPMLMGNSQIAHDALANGNVPLWGLGLSYVSGVCYELTGPGGQVTVAITDRCAGYCRCDGSVASDQASYHECGQYQCYDSPQMHPNVPCVGTLPQIGFPSCGGFGCASTPVQQCDWCASNNHPHFDLDVYAYNHVCGSAGTAGHCDITGVKIISCDLGVASPFSASSSTSSSSSGAVPANAFHCGGVPPSPEQPVIPGTSYCCNWGTSPNAQGSCGTSSASPPPASGSPPPSVSAPAASGGSSSSASSPSVPPPSPPPPGSCPPSATGCSLSSGQGRHVNAPANAFYCGGVSPCREEPLVPGTMFCCQKGTSPSATGACTPSSATTTHASHSFAHAGMVSVYARPATCI